MEQMYYLSKKAGISISESSNMPVFEFEMYIAMLEADMKEEIKQLER